MSVYDWINILEEAEAGRSQIQGQPEFPNETLSKRENLYIDIYICAYKDLQIELSFIILNLCSKVTVLLFKQTIKFIQSKL